MNHSPWGPLKGSCSYRHSGDKGWPSSVQGRLGTLLDVLASPLASDWRAQVKGPAKKGPDWPVSLVVQPCDPCSEGRRRVFKLESHVVRQLRHRHAF